jgi:hypothetical protein
MNGHRASWINDARAARQDALGTGSLVCRRLDGRGSGPPVCQGGRLAPRRSIAPRRGGPRHPARRDGLLEARPGSGRSEGLPHATQPLDRGPPRCDAHRARRAATAAADRGCALSSPFCRTRETARLAFGRATVSSALLNTVTADHDAGWRRQIRAARRLLGTKPAPGRVRVLVTHGSVVGDATGLTLEEGETLVFRPLGGSRFRLVGRILPRAWAVLRSG